jgi:hypothetical protein
LAFAILAEKSMQFPDPTLFCENKIEDKKRTTENKLAFILIDYRTIQM